MKLYELTDGYKNLMNLDLDEEDEGLQKALSVLDDAFEEKSENIAKVLTEIDLEAKAIKSEEERLYKRRKALENRATWLKGYLEAQMIEIDKKKFTTNLFTFSIQKNPASLRIIDESKIPEEFYIIEKKLNKKDLKEAVKGGAYTDCAELVQTASLRIR